MRTIVTQPLHYLEGSRLSPLRYKYTEQGEQESNVRWYHPPNMEKQNSIRSTNITKLSPSYPDANHAKSTTSTNQQTHPKTSTDNLHALRLESQILQLQKTLDQQQFEIGTLTEEASHFMKLCDQQKEVLIAMNVEALRTEYQEQIEELLAERHKVEDIIVQLQDDYNQVYAKEEAELNSLRDKNSEIYKQIQQELERKKSILSLIGSKDKQLMELEIDLRESEERIDQLRNIERKLTIALRELQMLRQRKATISRQQRPQQCRREQHATQRNHRTHSPQRTIKHGQSVEKKNSHKYKNENYLNQ